MRIRSKFILSFLAVSLLPLVVVEAVAYRNGREAMRGSLGSLFELRAAQDVAALDEETRLLYQGAQAWTALELMQDVLENDVDGRISSFLTRQARRNDLLTRAAVATAGGRIVAASDRRWIGGPIEGPWPNERRLVRDPCFDDVGPGGTPVLTCSFPVYRLLSEEKTIGTLVVSWDLGRGFQRRLSEAGGVPLPGERLLLRRDGLVISAPPRWNDWVRHRNLLEAASRAAGLAAAGGSGHTIESWDAGEFLVGYRRAAGPSGWSVLVAEEVESAFEPVRRFRDVAAALFVVAAIGIVAVSVVLSRRVTQPLLRIEDVARTVAAGDLEVRLDHQGTDEIASLSRGFDRMVEELKAQRAQLVDKQYLDSIFRHMADGLIVVDSDGRLEAGNQALRRMIGEPFRGELEGRAAGSLFLEGDGAFERRVLEPALAEGAVHEAELTLITAAGDAVPVSLSAGTIRGRAGEAQAVVCVLRDVSRPKQVEAALVEAREAAEAGAAAKSQFLAMVSHEVRTPLNGIIAMTELLASTRLTPEQQAYSETARRSGEALLALVSDILDFSSLGSGGVELETVEFDLEACLEEVSEILWYRAHEKGLELVTVIDPALPRRVRGDSARVRQVLLNLGSNAVKFSERGDIVIRAEPAIDGAPWVCLSVEDNGPGIRAGERERVFQPFFQIDGSATRHHGGTGLGLAISRQIVERMGGRIGLDSSEGRGSTFWCVVPLEAAATPEAVQTGDAAGSLAALRGLRVLIIDDNATNRLVLRGLLKQWRCLCDEAADAWEALEKLRSAAGTAREYQLALVDFQMPEMDGGRLAQEIRADGRLDRLTLILVTSVPQHGEAGRSSILGFQSSLTKPVRARALRRALDEALGQPTRQVRLALVGAKPAGAAPPADATSGRPDEDGEHSA